MSIAHDSGLAVGPSSPTEFTLGHNVSSKEEVDAVMQEASKAGAVVVKDAHDTFWGGYAAYFQDPNGHLWEIAWNPAWARGYPEHTYDAVRIEDQHDASERSTRVSPLAYPRRAFRRGNCLARR
jgi:hypothetical protein